MNRMIIDDYGYNDFFRNQYEEIKDNALCVGRVLVDYGQEVKAITNMGEVKVQRTLNTTGEAISLAVGDWIAIEEDDRTNKLLIYKVLDRWTKFSRKAPGPKPKEQIVAANVDTVFIIQSLNKDFNMRRLERYMIAAWESGAQPVIVLTKSDCCEDIEEKKAIVRSTAPGVEVHAVCSISGEGLDELEGYLQQGKTVALLGSSGVGKSTLVNTLLGEQVLDTGEIREDDSRGRHTTTHREIILLPNKALIMDTPGMRSLSLWEPDYGMDVMFGDIEELITKCRFHDCKHNSEPGCAVKEALESGELEEKRWLSWLKLQKEKKHVQRKEEKKQKISENRYDNKKYKRKKRNNNIEEFMYN